MIVEPTSANIAEAARLLRDGRLIGMPTETVYGIAADALNPAAVKATFDAKGRPSDNPLIVHVANLQQVQQVVAELPQAAERLIEKFWPGPLTLVLPKRAEVPDPVTGGLKTVAVRMPAHPVAQALIEVTDRPVSAPSANRFMSLSPTTAEMIDAEIAARLAMVLDGGSCKVGIESTVLDLSQDEPMVLRPGHISAQEIEAVLGQPVRASELSDQRRSPGMYRRHYAPQTPLRIVERLTGGQPGLTFGPPAPGRLHMPSDPEDYASRLYAALGELDEQGFGTIFVEAPPLEPEWNAIWDRLKKAASEP